jgi:RNA polymerase sigma-70 factor (ECF subfamily)
LANQKKKVSILTALLLTDEELVLRCKKELPAVTTSFEILVQHHINRVYNLVFRIVNDKEEAEDLTQEVFIKVFHGLKKFEQQAAFTTWLYRIANNTALDALDKTRRRPAKTLQVKSQDNIHEEVDLIDKQPAAESGPEENYLKTELHKCISSVLKKMDREQAKILVLRDFDELSYEEITRLLGAGMSAVKMRIHRSRLTFQKIFKQFCGAFYLNQTQGKSGTRE